MSLNNIERAKFHRGYVGYEGSTGVVWRIYKSGRGWTATRENGGQGNVFSRPTLAEVGKHLETL